MRLAPGPVFVIKNHDAWSLHQDFSPEVDEGEKVVAAAEDPSLLAGGERPSPNHFGRSL